MKLRHLSIALGSVVLLAAPPVHANLTFNLIPDAGMPQYAVDGFSAAANLWSSVLADNVTINLQIGFSSLGPGILGETDSSFVERSYPQILQALKTHRTSQDDFSSYAGLQTGVSYSRLINHTSDNPNGPNSATPYVDTMDRVGLTTANAKVLGLVPQDSLVDATIRFSSDFSFDFNHGSSITPGEFDFVGVAAHEIGHVLGFVSGVDDIDSLDGVFPGDNFSSNLIDLFRYSELSKAAGIGFTDYTADTRDKFFSVDGGNTAIALFATGVNYGDGNQASHWPYRSPAVGIMTPAISPGQELTILPPDIILFDVLGYTVVPEPCVAVLLGAGLFFLLARHFYRRQNGRTC